jgi:hypothetical protein
MNNAQRLWGAKGRRICVTGLLLVASVASFVGSTSCHKVRKVSQKQCDELLDRFSELVVKERMPDEGGLVRGADQVPGVART